MNVRLRPIAVNRAFAIEGILLDQQDDISFVTSPSRLLARA